MEEALSSLNYLKQLLPNTKDIELKNSIAELMKSNLKIMTLTNIKDDYILEYVDHPFLPQEKDSPYRILIIIIGFLVSFFSAVTLLFISSSIKEKGREST
jgi:LPS O-antigen subunit length determinant protein (WzzB/FepE family)